jgi:hypothetical protein
LLRTMAIAAAAAALMEATIRAQPSRQIAAAVASSLLGTIIECSCDQNTDWMTLVLVVP